MPDLEQNQFQKRQVAYKIMISSILGGNYTKDDSSAGHLKINDAPVSRVNIMANLVYKSEEIGYSSAIIDDGSGKISLKSFENNVIFAKIDVGDVILVIGKVREFNKERYVMPEIIKKISNIVWMNVRRLELREDANKKIEVNIAEGNIAEEVSMDKEVYELIKKLDYGDGVTIEDLVNNCENKDAEKVVRKLLENGDVFEIKPGKIKVLE